MNQLVLSEVPNSYDPGCAETVNMAERELAAYLNAVTALSGAKQAQLAAKDWLQELEKNPDLPHVPWEWRVITIKAARRLATRLGVAKQKEV